MHAGLSGTHGQYVGRCPVQKAFGGGDTPTDTSSHVPAAAPSATWSPFPLPPPVASARHCHMTRAAWHAYMGQLALGGFQRDAHCYVNGVLLNTRAYYKSTGLYRWPR